MKIGLVIATYDEVASIRKTLNGVLDVPGMALVTIVDGGSSDGTCAEVQAASAADNRVELIHACRTAGYAHAIRSGLKRSLAGNCSYIVNMDADGSHFASDIPRLVDAASRADLVIGSRYVKGASITGWPGFRRLLSRGWNAYAAILNDMAIRDMSSGFRCFNVKSAAFAACMPAIGRGFAFHVATATRLKRSGARIVEVPIRFQDRLAGESKLSMAMMAEAVLIGARLAVESRTKPAAFDVC